MTGSSIDGRWRDFRKHSAIRRELEARIGLTHTDRKKARKTAIPTFRFDTYLKESA